MIFYTMYVYFVCVKLCFFVTKNKKKLRFENKFRAMCWTKQSKHNINLIQYSCTLYMYDELYEIVISMNIYLVYIFILIIFECRKLIKFVWINFSFRMCNNIFKCF